MVDGRPFEVSKEVYDRAKARYGCVKLGDYIRITDEDAGQLFSDSIRWGYGLYNCMVHEEDGKYICTWQHGNSCD